MSQRNYPDWISGYMQYSAYSESPDSFHFWTAVGCIAGALRRRVWIDQGYFQWTPNFYIVFVAPPGIVSKSTTANIGMNLLRRVPGIHFGPDAVTWQSLIQSLAQSTELIEVGPEEFVPQSAITIVSSEFGTFLNPSDREMVDVMVSLWDGQIGVWEKATKTQGNDSVQNPWINLIACTTPAWIAGNFPEYMIGGGFTSRTVFVYAEQKRHLIAYPKDQLPADFAEMGDRLVHDLEIIATKLVGEYKLSDAARRYGEQWYEEHYSKTHNHLDGDRFGGYLARKQTHIHKLAMVLAAARRDALVIDEPELSAANAIITALEGDMPKVFENIAAPEARNMGIVIRLIEKRRKVSSQDLYRVLSTTLSWGQYEEALQSAIKAGRIVIRQNGNSIMLYAADAKELQDG